MGNQNFAVPFGEVRGSSEGSGAIAARRDPQRLELLLKCILLSGIKSYSIKPNPFDTRQAQNDIADALSVQLRKAFMVAE